MIYLPLMFRILLRKKKFVNFFLEIALKGNKVIFYGRSVIRYSAKEIVSTSNFQKEIFCKNLFQNL